jgi:hypothetical protein
MDMTNFPREKTSRNIGTNLAKEKNVWFVGQLYIWAKDILPSNMTNYLQFYLNAIRNRLSCNFMRLILKDYVCQ